MPRAAFKLAWDTIQAGKEFFGYDGVRFDAPIRPFTLAMPGQLH